MQKTTNNSQFSIVHFQFSAFTLIELMISISIIAILTIAAIPSFTGFSKSQALTQAFKTLKSDLRIAQSRSISGATTGTPATAKAWGIHFVDDTAQYQIFVCTPVQTASLYTEYVYSNARCGTGTPYKTITLGSSVKINGLSPVISGVLDVVFDSQNGSVYANGNQVMASIGMTYTDDSGLQTLMITAGGGISD